MKSTDQPGLLPPARNLPRLVLSAVGMLLALILLVVVIFAGTNLKQGITSFSALARQLVGNTQSALTLADDTLTDISASFTALEDSLDELEDALAESSPMLEDVGRMLGEDLVVVVNEGQTSLDSAAASSILIDNTLGLLSRIPLIGINYAPEIPLNTSLANLSDSFAEIPGMLTDIQADLDTSSANLAQLGGEVGTLNSSLADVNRDLLALHPVMDTYQDALNDLDTGLIGFEQTATAWLVVFVVLISLALAWWLFSQGLAFVTTISSIKSGTIPTTGRHDTDRSEEAAA